MSQKRGLDWLIRAEIQQKKNKLWNNTNLDTEIIKLLWHLHSWLDIMCGSCRVFMPESASWKRKMSALPENQIILVIFNTFFLISLNPPPVSYKSVCNKLLCLWHLKHWHFIFLLGQGHRKVIWKDKRRDSSSSSSSADWTGIKSPGPAAILTDEGCMLFSHITVSLIKAHPWVL